MLEASQAMWISLGGMSAELGTEGVNEESKMFKILTPHSPKFLEMGSEALLGRPSKMCTTGFKREFRIFNWYDSVKPKPKDVILPLSTSAWPSVILCF